MKAELRACVVLLATTVPTCQIALARVNTTPNTFAVSLGQDRTTRGDWKGAYGQDGYLIVGEGIQIPSYSTFDPHSTVNTYLYDYWSADPRALLKAHPSYSLSERIAAYFHSLTTMQIDVSTADNQPHRIAFYLADFENAGRIAIVEAIDTLTGTIYDAQEISRLSDSFGQDPVYRNGVYLVYLYKGRVTFRIRNGTEGLQPPVYRDTYGHTCATTINAYGQSACATGNTPTVSFSGIFWGGSAAPGSLLPMVISVRDPPRGPCAGIVSLRAQAFTQLVNLPDHWLGVGIRSVQFMLDGQDISPEIASPDSTQLYTFAWDTTTVPSGAHVLTAVARDGMGDAAVSAPVAVNVDNGLVAPPASGTWAKVIGFDSITAGDWKGVYGQDGTVIAQSSIQLPGYSMFDSRSSANSLLRSLFSYDGRALLKQFPNYIPNERVESEFSSMTAMEFLVSSADNQVHRLALYFADWDRAGKMVLVETCDAQSGATLAAATVNDYRDGSYVVFRYRGPIVLRIVNLASATAATVSGFFWGGGGPY